MALLSAVLFGLPHLRGLPSGAVGAVMAGVLGWLLCLSVLQTGGMLWAWSLHAVLDVVILSLALAVGTPPDPATARPEGAPGSAGEAGLPSGGQDRTVR
ncbi:MAG: CPBP family glutamic-type intramembrane protease [Acidimicrobiia bacterium]